MPNKKKSLKGKPAKKTAAKKPAARKVHARTTRRATAPTMTRALPGAGAFDEQRDNLDRDVHVYCKDTGWSDPNVLFRVFVKGKISQLLFHQKIYPNPGDKEIDIREFAGTDLHRWLTAGDPGHPCKTNLAEASRAIAEKAASPDDPMRSDDPNAEGLLDVIAQHYE